MEMRLEVVVIPVADVDRAKDFYPERTDWYARYMADEQDGQAARS
jgi:catechol 2,3-dioxygenase-like lactoylglutathione lyase family enzyme